MSAMPPEFNPSGDPRASAAAAKAYAKAVRPWYKKKRFIIPLVFVALLSIGALGGAGEEEPSETNEAAPAATTDGKDDKKAAANKPAKKAAPKVSYVKANAGDIVKEFETNELAGDTKYDGKYLQITGTVAEIDTEMFDDDQYVLRLGTGADFEFLYVSCNDMAKSELAQLTVGQDVTVRGKFDDGGDLGVEVKDCKLA